MSERQAFDSIIFSALQGRDQPSGALPGREREREEREPPASFRSQDLPGPRAPVPQAPPLRLHAASGSPCPGARQPPRAPPPARPGSGRRGCPGRRAQAPPGGVSAPQGGGVVGTREGARARGGGREGGASVQPAGGWRWGN